MVNLWKQSGIPHRGWSLLDVIDVREGGQREDETDYETCMMCGNEKIRYVHIVEHAEIDEEFRVGCMCAEKMTNDYVNPAKREKDLRNKASRRKNWSRKNWQLSKKGNLYLKIEGHLLVIFTDKKTGKFKVMIDETTGVKSFDTIDQAKTAAFNGVEYFKESGDW